MRFFFCGQVIERGNEFDIRLARRIIDVVEVIVLFVICKVLHFAPCAKRIATQVHPGHLAARLAITHKCATRHSDLTDAINIHGLIVAGKSRNCSSAIR